ncbi:hypothetical protein [Legionella sp. CNM-4043-24]|uniref:hypothetical protein n=1 Tax=Legionella sp. CNM-4043-24 TaxID=3421646 RepID=UPI00403ACD49
MKDFISGSSSCSSMFSPARSNRDEFMDAVEVNDIDRLRLLDIGGLELQDFERAFDLLERANPAWQTLPLTNMTRAYMTGLKKEIEGMTKPSASPAP